MSEYVFVFVINDDELGKSLKRNEKDTQVRQIGIMSDNVMWPIEE